MGVAVLQELGLLTGQSASAVLRLDGSTDALLRSLRRKLMMQAARTIAQRHSVAVGPCRVLLY